MMKVIFQRVAKSKLALCILVIQTDFALTIRPILVTSKNSLIYGPSPSLLASYMGSI